MGALPIRTSAPQWSRLPRLARPWRGQWHRRCRRMSAAANRDDVIGGGHSRQLDGHETGSHHHSAILIRFATCSRGGESHPPGRWQGRSPGYRRRVTGGGSGHQRAGAACRAGSRLPGRLERVACAGHTHGLMEHSCGRTAGRADGGCRYRWPRRRARSR